MSTLFLISLFCLAPYTAPSHSLDVENNWFVFLKTIARKKEIGTAHIPLDCNY
jgi:hypothetical protein